MPKTCFPLQWEIHQDLPYGTMADDEMRRMNIGVLQDDGVIFLWVTGTFTPGKLISGLAFKILKMLEGEGAVLGL